MQTVAGAHRVVVGAGAVDDPVDEHRLDLAAAASAPAHANLLADELEIHEAARMDVELLVPLQLFELRQRLLGEPMAVDVPIRTRMSQEPLPLASW